MTEERVCPICFGREVVELEQTHYGIPITEPCRCAVVRDIRRNLARGWVGIVASKKLKSSVLMGHENEDLFITATDATLRAHLRYIGIQKGRNWSFLVVSDADLMSAWLATKKYEGAEIFDRDARETYEREEFRRDPGRLGRMTLEDLVEPAGLLVIRLGVKSARNSAMPEVFLEALTLRDHINRPTWVVDRPGLGRFNGPGTEHRCYSPEAEDILLQWPYFELDATDNEAPKDEIDVSTFGQRPGSSEQEEAAEKESEAEAEETPKPPTVRAEPKYVRGEALTFSSASGAETGGTKTVEAPPEQSKNKWKKRGRSE